MSTNYINMWHCRSTTQISSNFDVR